MKPLLPICLFILLASCKDKTATSNDGSEASASALLFDTISIEREGGNCEKSETHCITVNFQYPQFRGTDSVSVFANRQIRKLLLGSLADSLANPDSLASALIREYMEESKISQYKLGGWQYEKNVEILWNHSDILSLRFDDYEYTGGAHPSSNRFLINFQLQTRKRINLSDVFVSGYEDSLNTLAEYYFRQARQLDFETDLNEAGFDFESQKFKLNDNFGLESSGITFVFNAYEIAAYSEGSTEFTIPWKELINRGLIRSDGPLAFLIGQPVS